MLLDEEPLAPAAEPPPNPAAAASAAAASAPGSANSSDPLSLLVGRAEAATGHCDMYHVQQQQAAASRTQQQGGPAGGDHRGGAAGGSSSGPAAASRHCPQDSLTLDSLEIGADDSSFLSGAGGEGGVAGPSTRPAPAMHISVSDPVRRVGDSMIPGFTSTHTEYLVTTTLENPRRRVEVRRRFRDFVVRPASGCVMAGLFSLIELHRAMSQLLARTWHCSSNAAHSLRGPALAPIAWSFPFRRWQTCWPSRSAAISCSRGEVQST